MLSVWHNEISSWNDSPMTPYPSVWNLGIPVFERFYYLRHGEGYVFIVVRCFVCLSVCLPVSNITEKRLNAFSWYFQGRWDLIQGTIGNIFGMFHLTPWTQNFPPLFRSNPCLLAALQKSGWANFHEIFRKGHDTGSNLEHFRDVTVNPLNPGSIYLFQGKTGERICHHGPSL